MDSVSEENGRTLLDNSIVYITSVRAFGIDIENYGHPDFGRGGLPSEVFA